MSTPDSVNSGSVTLASRVITFWTEPTNDNFLPALRGLLEGASGSLKILLGDCDLAGCDLLRQTFFYVTGFDGQDPGDNRNFLEAKFGAVRTAAITKHKWDLQKGPHLFVGSLGVEQSSPRRVALTSRCMTVEVELAMVNVKFPAVPGEANQPRLRVRVTFNPHDSKQSQLFDAAVLHLSRRADVQHEEPYLPTTAG